MPRRRIFAEDEIPEGQEVFLELNAELAEVWPNITEQKDAPADAAEWDGVENKLQYPSVIPLKCSRATMQVIRVLRTRSSAG